MRNQLEMKARNLGMWAMTNWAGNPSLARNFQASLASGDRELDSSCHAHNFLAPDFQYFHDVRLVWSSAPSKRGSLEGGAGKLGDRILRILLSGSRQPLWKPSIQCCAA